MDYDNWYLNNNGQLINLQEHPDIWNPWAPSRHMVDLDKSRRVEMRDIREWEKAGSSAYP